MNFCKITSYPEKSLLLEFRLLGPCLKAFLELAIFHKFHIFLKNEHFTCTNNDAQPGTKIQK